MLHRTIVFNMCSPDPTHEDDEYVRMRNDNGKRRTERLGVDSIDAVANDTNGCYIATYWSTSEAVRVNHWATYGRQIRTPPDDSGSGEGTQTQAHTYRPNVPPFRIHSHLGF